MSFYFSPVLRLPLIPLTLRNIYFVRLSLSAPPLKKMKDASPGEDGVRLGYLLKGGRKMLEEVVKLCEVHVEERRGDLGG